MCGIIAHVGFNNQSVMDKPKLQMLNDLLVHRGPDDEGFYFNGPVSLSMRRLSIVDLPGGHQPMTSADGRYTLVFNGEIYNYQEIRKELLGKGIGFQTNSDSEVLLYSYIHWGKDCLKRFNGMFAFAVWDAKERVLFAARDRIGMKPLYYTINHERVMLCSELTPIIRSGLFKLELNHQAVCDYLAYWYICQPKTIFKDVFQLPPGHCALIARGAMAVEKYWQIPTQENRMSFGDAAEQLENLLKSAVHMHMGADVTRGTFLSGGIDSGLITAMASGESSSPLESFAIGFKEKSYDERALAALTARKFQVHLNTHEMKDINPRELETIIATLDEPLGNASYVPTFLLAQAARTRMKVVLTGDGGDELFGGYPTYQAPFYQELWQKTPGLVQDFLAKMIAALPVSHRRISLEYRLKQLMQGIGLDYRRAHGIWREIASRQVQAQLWKPELWKAMDGYDAFTVNEGYFTGCAQLSKVNQLMAVDFHTYLLNDHLVKLDRMSMAHGLEARMPFLDYRVVEFAMQLPAEHKVDLFKTKIILKDIARGYLPKAVVHGKKKGLTAPIASWLCGPLKEYVSQELKEGLVGQLFQGQMVNRLLEEHFSKQKDNSRLLWALLTLQVWAKQKL